MYLSLNNQKPVLVHHLLVAIAIIISGLPAIVLAGDSDQELLNQLYREIITSSVGKTADTVTGNQTNDLSTASDNQIVPSTNQPDGDPAHEQLQREIDRMMNDSKVRHMDAVRFMQDTH